MKTIPKFAFVCTFALLSSACSGLGDDNTITPAPLVNLTPSHQILKSLWTTSVGGDLDKDYLRLGPSENSFALFLANKQGKLTALARNTGKPIWSQKFSTSLTSAPVVNEENVLIETAEPALIALDAKTGKILWKSDMPSASYSPPALSPSLVVSKTIDGKLIAFNTQTGQQRWIYVDNEPSLVLRVSSRPYIIGNKVIAGFSNGKLIAVSNQGTLLWERKLAVPQGISLFNQMVDIAADPVIANNIMYAATLNGKLAAVDLGTGNILWSRNFSTYSGMALGKYLYVTDQQGFIWAFNKNTGNVIFNNETMANRGLSAPAVLKNALVVGDMEGYLHFVSLEQGIEIAHTPLQAKPIINAPLLGFQDTVIVASTNGHLSAWQLINSDNLISEHP